MSPRITRPYFAHAVNSYDTPLERSLVSLIANYFAIPEGSVENPNQPRHQEGYKRYAERASQASTNHKGMNYFYDEVLPACDGCVAMPFLDGRMGLGVAGEVSWFIKKDLPTFLVFPLAWITPDGLRRFEKDYCSGLFDLEPLIGDERKLIATNDPARVVPHEETRLRTFFVYGREKRPFETAHLVTMPPPPGFYPDQK